VPCFAASCAYIHAFLPSPIQPSLSSSEHSVSEPTPFYLIYQLPSKLPSSPIHHFKYSITFSSNLAQFPLQNVDLADIQLWINPIICSVHSYHQPTQIAGDDHKATRLGVTSNFTPEHSSEFSLHNDTLTNLSTVALHIFLRYKLWWTFVG
jgi:hypothetical protein